MTTPAHRGFADPEVLAVAERIYQARLIEGGAAVFELMSALELEAFVALVRTALGAVRAQARPPSLRGVMQLPGSWWIAQGGDGDPAVWELRPGTAPRVVITQSLAGWRLWSFLYAALPDRGTCEDCWADPCPRHAAGAAT